MRINKDVFLHPKIYGRRLLRKQLSIGVAGIDAMHEESTATAKVSDRP